MDFYLHDCDYTIKAKFGFKNGSLDYGKGGQIWKRPFLNCSSSSSG